MSEKYDKEQNIELYTASKYTKDGIEKWIFKWKKNGWKTANRQDVKNIDLWKNLDELNKKESKINFGKLSQLKVLIIIYQLNRKIR